MTLSARQQRTLCPEYSLSRGAFAPRLGVSFAADRLITVCAMAWLLCMLLLCRAASIWRSPEPCSAVSNCAIFIYNNHCCLVGETILLATPHQNPFLSRWPQSQTAYLPSSNYQLACVILTAMSTLRAPCSSHCGSLGTIFGSVGFACGFVFLVTPTNRECAIHQGHYVASSLLRLRRCFLRSAFSHLVLYRQIWLLNVFQVQVLAAKRFVSETIPLPFQSPNLMHAVFVHVWMTSSFSLSVQI